MVTLLVKCDWAYLKEKPQNEIPNAFMEKICINPKFSKYFQNWIVLPTCSNQSDQTKASIFGGLWIVPLMYMQFIPQFEVIKQNPQFQVDYGQSYQSISSLSALLKRLSIYQSTIRKNLKFSNKYHYKLGVQCLPKSTRETNHKHTFGRFAIARMLKSCSLLAHCTPSPSFMNVRQGIPLFTYIGRQFVLIVSIIRRLTGKRRGQSIQHLQFRLLNILSFQPLDFIKEIGIS